jgi:hypothetical protein
LGNEKTVTSLAQYEAEGDGAEDENTAENSYTSYDLNEIYPFLMYKPESGDSLESIANRVNTPLSLLCEFNKMDPGSEVDCKRELIVLERAPVSAPGLRELTVGDLMEADFDGLLQKVEPPVFLVQYCTVRGIALGKLTLTDYEIMFEPLNSKLKGFINQECSLTSRRLLREQATAAQHELRRRAR